MRLRETSYPSGRVYIVGPIEQARARLASLLASNKGARLVWEQVDYMRDRATFEIIGATE
jgi:hypothetical protein